MNRKTQHGFTIIELMIALLVGAILMVVGVPTYQNMVQSNRTASLTNTVVASLNLARSEAIKRSRDVQICISNNETTCTGADWADGWIVWVDLNGSGAGSPDQDIERLFVAQCLDGATLTVTSQANVALSSITYSGSGFLDLPGTVTSVTFGLQPEGCLGDYRRQIRLIATGRPNTSVMSCI